MKFYQEITLLPSVDIDINFLWQKLFQPLHLNLVSLKNQENLIPVGISFPEYQEEEKNLGTKIRLFGPSEDILIKLDISNKLALFKDYMHITAIRPVPHASVKQHAIFSRWRGNTNIERLARRRAKRKNETLEQAMQHFHGYKTDTPSAPPYVTTKSLSTDKDFRLFISMKKVAKPTTGLFTCYGLSVNEDNSQASIPLF